MHRKRTKMCQRFSIIITFSHAIFPTRIHGATVHRTGYNEKWVGSSASMQTDEKRRSNTSAHTQTHKQPIFDNNALG